MKDSKTTDIFLACSKARADGVVINRSSRRDKEFHFQDWFAARLADASIHANQGGRLGYPDFTLVGVAEGYELKGLAVPGRANDFDCNSRIPRGRHNGQDVFYVFGRYPDSGERELPLMDFVICHGSFLNARLDYEHQNKNVKGFGSYGDVMIRDRKMYVAKTPFGLLDGVIGQSTLVVPAGRPVDQRLVEVGKLTRRETDQVLVRYTFDLQSNTLEPTFIGNKHAGQEHDFVALRAGGGETRAVTLKPPAGVEACGAVEADDEK